MPYISISVCVCILYKQKPMSSIFQDLHPIRSRCFGTVPTSSCPTKAPRRVGSPPFPNGGGVGKHSLGGDFNGDFIGISWKTHEKSGFFEIVGVACHGDFTGIYIKI